MESLIKLQEEITISGKTAIMELVQEEMEEKRKKTIIIRAYNNKAHTIDRISEKI